jgi:hypothetical protein
MKIATLCLVVALFASACSHKPDTKLFVISADDVSAAPVLMPSDTKDGIVEVHFAPSRSAEFGKFWQEHSEQQVQIAIIVAKPEIHGAYTGKTIQLHFATPEQAKTVAALLTTKQ